jgi:NhaP-type Na+/H+ or K+/H+ antiporter
MDGLLLGLCLVIVFSVLARLFGQWARIPEIVPLLVVGVLAGVSVTGLIDPAELLGDSLSPFVQIVVAIILFEGGLGLKREELGSGVRSAVARLMTLGVLITWVLATIAVMALFDLPRPISILIGAVLIVSGPTVVLPLLDFIGPPGRVRSVLKWEGILVDPIGAIIAVVVYGSLLDDAGDAAFNLIEIVFSLLAGGLAGVVVALALMPLLSTRRLAGRDKVAATLMAVVVAFGMADWVHPDSGLLAAIVLGVVLANQRRANVTYIYEFKETLVPILVGILFVLLAANVEISDVIDLGIPGLALVVLLALVVRPLAVLTTVGLPLDWRERALMATMAPRGIVAASTASAFGIVLVDRGVQGAEDLIPITFLVIAGTVVTSSILGPLVARVFGLSGSEAPAVLIVGAPAWSLPFAGALREAGAETWFWTPDAEEAERAREAGMTVSSEPLDLTGSETSGLFEGASAVILISPDDTMNDLLALQLAEILEADQVLRLDPGGGRTPVVRNAGTVFRPGGMNRGELGRVLAGGGRFEVLMAGAEEPPGAIPLAWLIKTRGMKRPEFRLTPSGRMKRSGVLREVVLVPGDVEPV